MLKAKCSISPIIIFLIFTAGAAYAQPTWTIDPFGKEKKPEQYEEKVLGSEKTADKKFTFFRRFVQNNVTHYNYYFNANNKLNRVIELAKLSQKDDYTQLLSFYPYSLENTSAQQTELDSVIYKATAGILLHDLRSDWVDNMYLLIGKAYYYRNQLDSAALTFQFINYNLFPRKKNEDDGRVVGSNAEPGYKSISIANPENRNILQKAFTLPPSRNDALIWLARTFTEQGEFADAAGLINILQNDRNLPSRLKNDLEEVNAYWFYAQNNYDSSAAHLENALSAADNKQDKSRWEFLLAQMYELTGNYDKASDYYAKVSRHTVDPIMDIFARLNDAKMMRDGGNTKELENSIANLLRMAKRDKYETYRDVIYYSAAQLSMQRPDTANSLVYYRESVENNIGNSLYKNRAYYQMANIAYGQQRYRDAKNYYDSLSLNDDLDIADSLIDQRKQILGRLVDRINTIEKEDSLQRVAAMLPADRDAYVKALLKKYRKAQGLKDDEFAGNSIITFNNGKNASEDLFAASSKGDWYFYNNNLRTRGYNDFKAKWGKRNNTDNWRRKTASEVNPNNNSLASNVDIDALPVKLNSDGTSTTAADVVYTYDAMIGALPLSPEALDSSNKLIAENMLALARIFQNELEDYNKAIQTYEEYLARFSRYAEVPEAYYGLYVSYTQLGNKTKADYYKNLLSNKYAGNKFTNILTNPIAEQPMLKTPEVTLRYARIYDMYIEGNFNEAYQAKQSADSLYGNNYWSPQLLYIEAVHLIKERQDSLAIVSLTNLKTLYPDNPLAAKASTMIDVLGRRTQIENYLANLEVTRQEETQIIVSDDKPAVKNIDVKPAAPSITKIEPTLAPRAARDSIKAPAVFVNEEFTLSPNQPHYVIMILDKVDPVYINEAKNAFSRFNRENYLYQKVVINRDAIDEQKVILVFSDFTDINAAITYYDKVKKAAPSEVSWLPANKYSFLVISEANLSLLKKNKKLDTYKQLLNNNFSNKF